MARLEDQIALVGESGSADFLTEDLRHHVHPVAVHGVKTHAESVAHRFLELEVPTERKHPESMAQRDAAPVPFRVMEIQGMKALFLESGEVCLQAGRKSVHTSEVHEFAARDFLCTFMEHLGVRTAQPQTVDGEVGLLDRDGQWSHRGGHLDIKAEVKICADARDDIGNSGDVGIKVCTSDRGYRHGAKATPRDPVVVEDRNVIGGRPHI